MEIKLLAEIDVMRKLGITSRQTMYNYQNKHGFPKPIRTHPKAYLENAVNQWILNGGNYTRANPEDVMLAVRGQGVERASASVKQVVFSCLGKHSAKPWEVRRRLELLYGDVSRIELFSRGDAPGWDHWGNQCPVNSLYFQPAVFSKTLSDQ